MQMTYYSKGLKPYPVATSDDYHHRAKSAVRFRKDTHFGVFMGEYLFKDDSSFYRFIKSRKKFMPHRDYMGHIHSYQKLKRLDLPYIFDLDHLAMVCGVSSKQLNFFIHNKKRAYSSFTVPKKNGSVRTINAPHKNLKTVQRWIHDTILCKLEPGEFSHGFLPNRSIVTNAQNHVGQDLILGIDLKDFFPSIRYNRVFGIFSKMGYTTKVSQFLSEICTYDWCLPQGAPTSPMISNLIAWHLDVRLSKFCLKYGFNYSRYADDITISGSNIIPRYKTIICNIIESEGFEVNKEKVRVLGRGSAQKVTGLIVNDKVSLGKKRKKTLRAIIHNISKNGPILENKEQNPFFREKILGDLSFAYQVNPQFAQSLLDSIKEIEWNEISEKPSTIESRIIKESTNRMVFFDQLKIFSRILPPDEIDWSEDFNNHLNNLLEKCKTPSNENCQKCLYDHQRSFEFCIKHILGKFIGSTGGPHHGHEVCDLLASTELYGNYVNVAFLAKSGKMERSAKDALIRQVLENTEFEEIDVLSVVSNYDLDNKLRLNVIRLIKKCNENQRYCIIMRTEMGRILQTFLNTINNRN